jgi:Protein of unknown function (DUF3606)
MAGGSLDERFRGTGALRHRHVEVDHIVTRGLRIDDADRVAGGQDYEVRYEARKTGKSRAAVKKAVGKVGDSRKKRRLASG